MKEVAPFIEAINTGDQPGKHGLRSSLGALIALHTAIERPGVFGKLLLESPPLAAAHRQIIKDSRVARIWPERIFLAAGTAEAGDAARSRPVVDDVRELAAILRRAVLSEKRLRMVS